MSDAEKVFSSLSYARVRRSASSDAEARKPAFYAARDVLVKAAKKVLALTAQSSTATAAQSCPPASPPAPLSQYEQQRLRTIANNEAVLKALQVPKLW